MIGSRVRINRREDDEMGELALDHTQVRELLSICEKETERRKLCLEIAKEYAKQEDFESARRYLQANYLGSSPSYLKEEQKYLAEIHSRRRQEAEEAMRSQDTGCLSLEQGHRTGGGAHQGSQSPPNQTEERRFSSQAPKTRQPVRDINAVTVEVNRNALNVLNEDSREGSNEVEEPMEVDSNSGGESDSEDEHEPSRSSRSRESRESHDTRGSQTVEPGRSQCFAYASPAEVESGRNRIRGRKSIGIANPPRSRVALHKKIRSTFKENDEDGSRTAEHEQSTGVIVSEPESGTVYMVAQTKKWSIEETEKEDKPDNDKSKIDYLDSEPEPDCCCAGYCYSCVSCWL